MRNKNSDVSFGSEQLATYFYKVRVNIVRLKNKKFKETIDCSDFLFSKSIGETMIH